MKTSGAGASKHKKYVYNDQLQFLSKLYATRDIEENFEDDGVERDADSVDVNLETHPEMTDVDAANRRPDSRSRKRRKPDEVEMRMLKALEGDKPNRHLSFFNAVMPALEKFEEHEVLQFQMGVLQLISNITEKQRRPSQPPLFFSQPMSFQPTPPPFYPGHNQHSSQSSAQFCQNFAHEPQSTQSTAQHFGQMSTMNTQVNRSSESLSPAQSTSSFSSLDFANQSTFE